MSGAAFQIIRRALDVWKTPCLNFAPMAETPAAFQPGLSGFRALLTERNFSLYFAATSISTLGTAVAGVGLSLALLACGYQVSAVGLVLAAQTVATLVFTLAGGVAGDRWSRRSLMVASDLLRFCSESCLAILLATSHPPVAILTALGACVGIGNAFYRPAAGGLVPQIVTKDHLQNANAMSSLSAALSLVLGPAIGGLLVGLGGGVFTIAADAASYLASAALLTFVKFPAPQTDKPKTSLMADLRLGAQEFRAHRWLAFTTIQIAVVNALALAMLLVIGPALFAHLKDGPRNWGLVTSCLGAGAFLGGLIILRVSVARPLLVIQFCIIPMSAPFILLALHAPLPLLMLGSATQGVGMAMANTLFQTAVQKTIALHLLSRVSSLISMVTMSLIPIGYALSGPAAAHFGPRPTMGAGACLVLLTVAMSVMMPEIRDFGAVREKRESSAFLKKSAQKTFDSPGL
jgi:MFS family permease